MAMNVIQDQNFSVHFDGVKTNGSKIQKNRGGGLGGRKALNDISNSGKPPALNTSGKQNPKNVIPIGEDLGVPKKAHVSGRKALVDLTNSVKPITQRQSLKKKSRKNKSIAIADEGFLHNHDECIKLQKKVWDIDFDQFLRTYEDISCESRACNNLPRKQKDENVSMFLEMEDELLEMEDMLVPIIEDKVHHRFPIYGSPNPPSPVRIEDMLVPIIELYEFPSPRFSLTETPRR